MAFYGSAVANLSPLLFRGNLFSQGINVIFHADISYSMNIDSGATRNYKTFPSSGFYNTNIGVGATESIFYDGSLISYFQDELFKNKIGSTPASPNLYTYFDLTLRQREFAPTSDTFIQNTESYAFDPNVILSSSYPSFSKLKDLWRNAYIDVDDGVFTSSYRFNIAAKTASSSTPNRFSSLNPSINPAVYSEDVHGNIWSIYYSGINETTTNKSNGVEITEGKLGRIGSNLNYIPRRDKVTYVITASNEQENSADNLVGIALSTKRNVGYSTDTYKYNKPGLIVRRYSGYFEDPTTNPNMVVSGSAFTTEEFENWFNNLAAPLTTGGSIPTMQYYEGGSTISGFAIDNRTNLGGTNRQATELNIPECKGTAKNSFFGPFNEIDRLRTDLNGYSTMIIGYFSPQEDGVYQFKVQSNGATFLWMGNETDSGSFNQVYSGWNPTNALLACPVSITDRYAIYANSTISGSRKAAQTIWESTSLQKRFKKGRYYPFRLIFGNPTVSGSPSVTFPSNGNIDDTTLSTTSDNPSFLRVLFDVDPTGVVGNPGASNDTTGAGDCQYKILTTGYFYGERDVWKVGSQFFPPNVYVENATIEDELRYRNTRVISISGYDSDDGYDAVFFDKKPGDPPLYRYIKFNGPDSYTPYFSTTSPFSAAANWRFANHFKPVSYNIPWNATLGAGNTFAGLSEGVVGTGASFVVTKYNDRYILDIPVGYGGTGYKTGDKIRIPAASLGETDIENDLVVGVTSVQTLSYDVTVATSDLFVDRAITNPLVFVTKNLDGNNVSNYGITIQTGSEGQNFINGDILVIPGTELDGASPTNDLKFTVSGTGANGSITAFNTLTGTATTYIDYKVPLNVYNPRGVSFVGYQTQPITSIGYTFTNSTGIAYTAQTANIAGISYTTFNGIGIGNSAFTVSGIAYTTARITNLGFTTSAITSIGYTVRNVSSVGYTTVSAVSIGYTSPNIVSIGYTTYSISNITYPGSIGITDISKSGNADAQLTLNADVSSVLSNGSTIIIGGSGDFRIDGSRTVNSVSGTIITITSGLPNGSFALTTDPNVTKFGVVSSSIVGSGSSALLTTAVNNAFNIGDSIIIKGFSNPYTSWNSTFVVGHKEATNSVYLTNTAQVGLYTATSISGSGTTAGFQSSNLELEIKRPVEYQFDVGMGITVYGVTGISSFYNNGYVIRSIIASDGSGPYRFTLLENQTPSQLVPQGTNGKIGIHTLSGIATVTSTASLGAVGDFISIKVSGSSLSNFNNVIYDNETKILDGTRIYLGTRSYTGVNTNPLVYSSSPVGLGLTVGSLTSRLKISTIGNHGFAVGDFIRVQNVLDQFGNSFAPDADNDVYEISLVGTTTSFEVLKNPSTSTNFGLRGTNSGVVGLRANAILTTPSSHPFNTGDSIRIEGTTGNVGIFNNTFTVTKLSATTLYLNNTNLAAYTDDFADSTATGGIAGLQGVNATLTYSNSYLSYDFQTGQSIKIEGTGTTFDNNTYTVTRLSATSLSLDSTQNPTTYNVSGIAGSIALLNAGPILTYSNVEKNSLVSSILSTGDQIRLQGSTTGYNGSGFPTGVYTVKKYTNTTFGISTLELSDPTSFIGSNGSSNTSSNAGLLNSKVRVRTSQNHNQQTGNTVKIQNAGSFDGVYTIQVYDATRFDLDNTVGNGSTDYTLNDNSFVVGPYNYPAFVLLSSGTFPASFTTGRKVRLESTAANGAFNVNSGLSTNVQYTIVRSGTGNSITLLEAINPIDFTINTTTVRAVGLEDSPAAVTGSGFNSLFGPNQSLVPINIQLTDDFNGDYTARINSDTRLELLGTENPVTSVGLPTSYSLSGRDVVGVIGLRNSNRAITTPSSHGFTIADEGVTQIYVDVNNATAEGLGYDGTFTINKVYSTTRFDLQSTENPSTYNVTSSGYYVGVNTGIAVTTSSGNHYLDIGDQVVLSGTTNYNGTYTVQYVLSPTSFTLNSTYPASLNNYTIKNTTGTFQPQISPNGGSLGDAILVVRRGIDSKYYIPSVFAGGQAYKQGEQYKILGTSLGGATPANDAVVTVGTVNVGSLSAIPTITGSADNTLDYEVAKTASLSLGNGSNARFTIIRSGKRLSTNLGITTYSVSLTNGGSGYQTNNIIRIPGDKLGGLIGDGSTANIKNDLLIYVNNSLSGSTIVGSGITFSGISTNSAPLVLSGLSTIYNDGGRRSRPWGLEQVWDSTTSSLPPSEGANLRQKQDMLTVAAANRGGLFKANSVYKLGEYNKFARIEQITFHPVISTLDAYPTTNSYNGSIVYDTLGQSGIATIIFNNGNGGGAPFARLTQDEVIYILTSSHTTNPLAKIEFIDYRLTGYGHTILRVNTSYGGLVDPVDNITGAFNFTGGNFTNFAFAPEVDQVVIQTANKNALPFNKNLSANNSLRTANQNVSAYTSSSNNGMQAVIVSSASTLTVRLKGNTQTFSDGDIVTLRYSIDPIGGNPTTHSGANSQFFDSKSGIGFTSYRIRRVVDDNGTVGKNMFYCFDVSTDVGIGPDYVLPNGTKMIDLVAKQFVPSNASLTPSLLYGGQPDSTYSGKAYGTSIDAAVTYPYVGAGTTQYLLLGSSFNFNGSAGCHIRLAVEGEAYVVGSGITPVDNRIAMVKAISSFISDTATSK